MFLTMGLNKTKEHGSWSEKSEDRRQGSPLIILNPQFCSMPHALCPMLFKIRNPQSEIRNSYPCPLPWAENIDNSGHKPIFLIMSVTFL
jgi:hypothetical protein